MTSFFHRTTGFLLTVCFLAACLCGAILSVGLDNGYYRNSFTRYQVWKNAGISHDDTLRIAQAFPAFLSGDSQALDLQVEMDGQTQPAFHQEELEHMRDVAAIFLFIKRLFLCAGCACLFLLALVWLLRRSMNPRKLWQGALAAFAATILAVGILAAWAIIDFRGVFLLFHQLAFSNDLWLMNPETDLMIRLMPEEMFFDGAAAILGRFAIGFAAYWLLLWIGTHRGILRRWRSKLPFFQSTHK